MRFFFFKQNANFTVCTKLAGMIAWRWKQSQEKKKAAMSSCFGLIVLELVLKQGNLLLYSVSSE